MKDYNNRKERNRFYTVTAVPVCTIHMFLRLCDFGMILVWWFESGMIEWLWCDGLEVVYAKENNWRNCKQLWTKYTHFFLVFFKLRNITQSTSSSFRFLQLFHIRKWLDNILKTSEDQVIKPSVVIRFDIVYPRVSLKTLKSKSVLFYSFFYQ